MCSASSDTQTSAPPSVATATWSATSSPRFDAGDPVDLCAPDGRVIARGLVSYDAAEIPAMMGRSTHELAAQQGPEYEREIVHRDDLALLRTPR